MSALISTWDFLTDLLMRLNKGASGLRTNAYKYDKLHSRELVRIGRIKERDRFHFRAGVSAREGARRTWCHWRQCCHHSGCL